MAHIDYESPQRVQSLRAAVRVVEPAGFSKVSALGVEEQRVRLHRLENAVPVPVGALVPQGDAVAVYVLDGRRLRLQPIYLGESNAYMAWVQGGLHPGQSVVLYPPTQFLSGQKVQVQVRAP